jgi:predicted transposase YbfD/YdcC
MGHLKKAFRGITDPRAANARHDLLEVLVIALAAVLCGAETCADMADFGGAKEDLLRQFLRLDHGIPSHDTFSRVFRLLDPQGFEASFRRFMATFQRALKVKIKGVVAIDGKAVKGAYERGGKTAPLHLVNIWASEARLALAQRTAPGRNEVAGALEALGLLSLDGCIVTADALHCRSDIAAKILARGGDYALALKSNQPNLLAAVRHRLKTAVQRREADLKSPSSHDRSEHRHATVVRDRTLAADHDFPGICAVASIKTMRRAKGEKAQTTERFFLLSRPLSAKRLLSVVREHWGIENRLHWVLDVVFDEDRARNRKDHGPENLAIVRKLALNLLQCHPDKASIRRKVKRAGWDNSFLLSLFAHMR